MIDIAEHRADAIRRGDATYVPVARTWRIGWGRSGFSYTTPHRLEVTNADGNIEWVRIPDPIVTLKVLAAIVLVLGFVGRLRKG